MVVSIFTAVALDTPFSMCTEMKFETIFSVSMEIASEMPFFVCIPFIVLMEWVSDFCLYRDVV